MNLTQLKARLVKIKKMGFIQTHRAGNTGIGKTLEDLLGIKENNIPLPDIEGIAELKACRKDSKSMISLFTLEPSPAGGARDRYLLDNFGYSKRDNGRSKELHSTFYCGHYNSQNLKLSVEKDKVKIMGKGKRLNIYWDINALEKKFQDKLPALVYVSASTKLIKGKEWFHFTEAYFLTGFDFDSFKKMIKKDFVLAEFRMFYRPNGQIRNHGTAFRVKMNKLDDCFKKRVRLL